MPTAPSHSLARCATPCRFGAARDCICITSGDTSRGERWVIKVRCFYSIVSIVYTNIHTGSTVDIGRGEGRTPKRPEGDRDNSSTTVRGLALPARELARETDQAGDGDESDRTEDLEDEETDVEKEATGTGLQSDQHGTLQTRFE